MDYEKAIRTAQIFTACSGVNGVRCSSCPVFGKGDRHCARNAMKDGATAITDLLIENQALRNAANGFKELAEKAESRVEMLENANLILSVRITKAEVMAEKAERCIEEVNTAILLKSKTDALNAIKWWRRKKEA